MSVPQCPNRLCVNYRRPLRAGLEECPLCCERLRVLWETVGDARPRDHENFEDLIQTDPEAALREVTARRELHWAQCHPGLNPVAPRRPKCVACEVIDHQWRTARRSADGLRNA